MPYYGDALPYYYGGPFSNHSSLMTGTGRTLHSPLGSTRYAPHLTTISESPLSALRRYTPAATMASRPKRVINTADIDVSTPRPLSTAGNNNNNNNQRNRLRRDRPTIRIRSQALKDNPALREHYERHEKTVGELLVEKFLIKDKKPEADSELRTKLYTQVSLDSDLSKKQREELQEAIKRRITRRMTRRRSSADVQMDAEQIEREVLFAQAQADALDTLVAEEQAEIEVETRMGTLIRKNLVRAVAPLRTNQDIPGLSGDEDEETRTKKLAKKVKKRKKTTDKPSPPGGGQLDSEDDETRTKKALKDSDKDSNEKSLKTVRETINGGGEKEAVCGEVEDDGPCPESPTKALKFKIEASNSVGDFSTLWINARVAEEVEKQRKLSQGAIEQFRDSVRLPAPKLSVDKIVRSNKKDPIIEEHQEIVVLPVKKRYVKDDARNSVYLTLKAQRSTNAHKMAGASVTTDRIEPIDEKVDQSIPSPAMTNGKPTDASESTEISSMANRTMGIPRQPKINKVAKFRSKDNTESDVEVNKSISELEGHGETRGNKGTKDAGLQKLSGGNEDTSNVVTNESISAPLNRDANLTSAIAEDLSNDLQTPAEDSTLSKEPINLEIVKRQDSDDNRKLDHSKSNVSALQQSPVKKITSPQNGVTETSGKIKVDKKIDKPLLKRVKKKTKDLTINNCDSIDEESLKQSTPSSLDASSAPSDVKSLDDYKNDEKERFVEETNSSPASKSSALGPASSPETFPNEPIIDIPNVVHGLNDTVKISSEEFKVGATEDVKTRIAENFFANEDSSLSGKITRKIVESPEVEISKPIGVTSETSGVKVLPNLQKLEDKYRNVVEEHSATNGSARILGPPKEDLAKCTNDDELTKNIVPSLETTKKEDKDVESSKLRKNRKVLPIPSFNDSTEVVELSPVSPDLEVIPESPKKIQTKVKKRLIAPAKNDEPRATKIDEPLDEVLKEKTEIVIKKKIGEDSLEKKIDGQPILEPVKLTNGVVEKKPKSIIAIKVLPESKVTSKASKKSESPSPKKEEEIDFWGEIESQRDAESSLKPVEKVIRAEENSGRNIDAITVRSNADEDAMVIVSEPEVKSNTPPEIGPRVDLKTPEEVEKKSNKVKKKKKTSESSGCKKKDQEKASSETIFEHFTNSGLVLLDEESHQQPESLLEQRRDDKLVEKISASDPGEEIICESPEVDRFERNLSTIAEESLSPVSEEIPKKIEALDLVTSSLLREDNIVSTKLDTSEDSSLKTGESESRGRTLKEPEARGSLGEPEVSGPNKEDIPSTVPIEPKEQIDDVPATDIQVSLPTINIVQATDKPLEKEVLPEVIPEEEEEAEEGPGTPKNGSSSAPLTARSKNISKWHGLADLSLDEPEKDIGPEVYLEELKKESAKKKVGSSKKTSKKKSVGSNSTKSNSSDSSKKKKQLGKRKKSLTKNVKDGEKRNDERSGSKVSNSSDTTLKPGATNLLYSPKNSERNSPKQRPLDLIKMFYTTPASLLTATPRDLSKVRRAKVKKRKHSSRTASASSDSTGSTRSTGTTGSTEHEDDVEQKRISSTRSNDSGFDGSPRLSNCDMACHKKCEKLTGNLCGLNQKLVAEALQALKRAPSQSSDNQRNSDGSDHHASGRITPPATNLPRFKKYTVMDFNFLKVLGKGSFGKVLLAELRRTDCVYAVKCLKKDVVLEDDDVECTLIERKVLTLATRHPYLCHLFCTFQTDSHLFFVMEYLNGGDLMFHIQKSGRFAESRARFYAAEIWSGLNFLHKKGIVYRDLKLDNVLLDFEGHIRIADFGMCKLQIFLDRTADTFCGTPDYMAPEIIKGLKYNQAVDWWSFGVLLYEMLTGQSPFSGCDEDDLFWSICNERPFIPRYLSQEAMDVLICLLEKDAGKRPPGHEIAVHPFFHSLQWDRLERRQLEPPFKPALEHTLDTRYFDTAFTAERPRLTPVPEQILTSMDQGVFRGFSYTNPNATD